MSKKSISKEKKTRSTSLAKAPTGITGFDEITGGGLPAGRTSLVCGGAGCGKTSLAVHLVNAACGRGERCLYLASEESADQIIRNGKSIGDLSNTERVLMSGVQRYCCRGVQIKDRLRWRKML